MKYLLTPLILFSIMACSTQKSALKTVPEVDLSEYAGLWYDIVHLPARFMKDCECTTAEYGVTEKGYVTVKNKCRKSDSGKWTSITGKAFPVPNTGNAHLKVRFFWPLKGDYQILALDRNYRYALVGDKSRKYLWILSRTPQLDQKIVDSLLAQASDQGFDVEKVIYTKQDCGEQK